MPQAPLGNESRWSEKSTRTIFFLSAVLFHLILLLAVAGYILFPPLASPTPDPGIVNISPPTKPVQPPTTPIDTKIAVNTPTAPTPVVPTVPGGIDIKIHVPDITSSDSGNTIEPKLPPVDPRSIRANNLDARMPGIRRMVEMRRTPQQIADKDPSCVFPVYVASYADGDWSCNLRLDKDGNIEAGSIPNLVEKISEWSHGAVKGQVVPKPLDIASPELLDKMPPFIFFTGHKNFTLTDAEVENLRHYLNDGGMIWGDNALAGEGSRFDVAFHREMKRVIPDPDKNFKPYSLNDDIFKGKFPLSEIPAGMNYYAEAPQHLDLDGILAILYTPNDYSDMMFMKINSDDKSFFMTYKPVPDGTLYTNTSFVEKKSIFYRNFDLKSSLAVHHMGMDIITYLIIRFDDKLQLGH